MSFFNHSSMHLYGDQPNEKPFQRVIVIETLTDPTALMKDGTNIIIKSLLKTYDGAYSLDTLPRNAIIGQGVKTRSSQVALIGKPQIFFPFFSSHLCLPVKPGEHVWVMFEEHEIGTESSRIGFWLSRIHEKRDIEDVNQTSHGRKIIKERSAPIGTATKAGAKPLPPNPTDQHKGNPDGIPGIATSKSIIGGKSPDDIALNVKEQSSPVPSSD